MAGIFSLRDARTLQIRNIVDKNLNSFPESATYGYYGGGYSGPLTPSRLCTLDRIDFATETTSAPGKNLLVSRAETASAFNNSYGWFRGGAGDASPPSLPFSADRLDFATETVTAPGKNFPVSRSGHEGVSSNSYGYFVGGALPSPINCSIDRLDFSTETTSSTVSRAPINRSRFASTFSEYYGYFTGLDGGAGSPNQSTFDRLDFSTEIISRQNYFLPTPRRFFAGVSNKSYGYFGCGDGFSILERIEFSTETLLLSPNKFTLARRDPATVSSNSYGYYSGANLFSSVDRLNYSTDTISVLPTAGNLTQARFTHTGVPGGQSQRTLLQTTINPISGIYGYFGGGLIPTPDRSCIIDRLDFSTETVSRTTRSPSQARSDIGSVSSASYGYFACGVSPTQIPSLCIIERLDFSTEILTVPTSPLTIARTGLRGVSSSDYGYFGAGALFGGRQNLIERLDFSTESVKLPTFNLSAGKDGVGAVSTASYGYFGGGITPTPLALVWTCTINRLDFSTESVSLLTSQLSIGRFGLGAVSSASYGYFGGGYIFPGSSSVSTIDRLDFSTETVTVPTPKLSVAKLYSEGTSSSSYGYFAGGGGTCTIDRLDFSTETRLTPGTYQLTQARNNFTGTQVGRQKVNVKFRTTVGTYGYFGGGTQPLVPLSCSLNRLDFSTETVSAPTPTLTQGRFGLAALSNNFYGYFAGGNNPTPARSCLIDRIDFSNETTSAPGKGLTQARSSLATVSNNSFGYFLGGTNPTVRTCIIDRLDFSNETTLTSTAKLPTAKDGSTGFSNSSYGYLVGGFPGPTGGTGNDSTINRLDFLSETVSIPSFRVVSNISNFLASVSSASYGYFAGGFEAANPTPTNICIIERLDLSTETTSQPSKLITQQRYSLAAVSSASYGYFGGGNTPTPSTVNTIDRIDFFTETVSVPGKNLLIPRTNVAAVSNNQIASTAKKGFAPFSPSYGYYSFAVACNIGRIDFGTETRSLPGSKLSGYRSAYSTFESSNYGYFTGGSNFPGPDSSIFDRLDFSTESTSTPGTKSLFTESVAVSSSNYGYISGSFGASLIVRKFDYSNEVLSLAKNNLPTSSSSSDPNGAQGFRGRIALYSQKYGYFCGGSSPGNTIIGTSAVDRIEFSTETTSTPAYRLLIGSDYLRASQSYLYGYIAPPAGGTQKFSFDTESVSYGGPAPGSANDPIYSSTNSYFPTYLSSVSTTRFNFDTEIYSDIPVATYSSSNREIVTNIYKPPIRNGWGWRKTYGYFGGGASPSIPVPGRICTIDRLDFSTETVSRLQNSLSNAIEQLSSVSNPAYGYFSGGFSNAGRTCTIDRLDFSTQIISSPGKNLLTSRNQHSAVSSTLYGYFAGGSTDVTPVVCTIERMDFSTEIVGTPIVPAPNQLTIARSEFASLQNAIYGYFGGGNISGTATCLIDRLNFSTETVNATTAFLIPGKSGNSAVSSGSYGYFGGGLRGSYECSIDRLDFSTEIVTQPGKNFTTGRSTLSATSSGSYGYFGGGFDGTNIPAVRYSNFQRVDFTTETVFVPSSYLLLPTQNSTGIQAN